MRRFVLSFNFFQMELTVTHKASVIVMTQVGNSPRRADLLWDEIEALPAAPPGFCWRFVPEGPFAFQFRSILRMDCRAIVVWVGADDAIRRATQLIGRLLEAGLPTVIAIAEAHDAWTESALRQAGALYICANEAEQRLGDVLESILGPPSGSTDQRTIASGRKIRMDAG
jgi:hypothetical protein